MRRTGNAIIYLLGGSILFLGGCLVGVAAQQYWTSLRMAENAPQSAAPARVAAAEEPVFAQPIIQRRVKTIVVRADGSLAEPSGN